MKLVTSHLAIQVGQIGPGVAPGIDCVALSDIISHESFQDTSL